MPGMSKFDEVAASLANVFESLPERPKGVVCNKPTALKNRRSTKLKLRTPRKTIQQAQESDDSPQQEASPKQEGTIKFYKHQKGWGFIAPESGGPDLFLHRSVVSDDSQLIAGRKVRFTVGVSPNGNPMCGSIELI